MFVGVQCRLNLTGTLGRLLYLLHLGVRGYVAGADSLFVEALLGRSEG